MPDNCLSTAAVLEIFTQETQNRGGRVSETFHDRERLFVRSLLPNFAEVRPRDGFQRGIALRFTDGELCLHPYLFRQVCSNGAIIAHTLGSVQIEQFDALELRYAEFALREAIAGCGADDIFAESLQNIRRSTYASADLMLNMMPILSRLPQQAGMGRVVAQILERFSSQHDRTRYGLMNAVTSVARDTDDPDLRWRLEVLGGSIGAALRPRQPASPSAHRYAGREFAPTM
jgi:hypothetical protein